MEPRVRFANFHPRNSFRPSVREQSSRSDIVPRLSRCRQTSSSRWWAESRERSPSWSTLSLSFPRETFLVYFALITVGQLHSLNGRRVTRTRIAQVGHRGAAVCTVNRLPIGRKRACALCALCACLRKRTEERRNVRARCSTWPMQRSGVPRRERRRNFADWPLPCPSYLTCPRRIHARFESPAGMVAARFRPLESLESFARSQRGPRIARVDKFPPFTLGFVHVLAHFPLLPPPQSERQFEPRSPAGGETWGKTWSRECVNRARAALDGLSPFRRSHDNHGRAHYRRKSPHRRCWIGVIVLLSLRYLTFAAYLIKRALGGARCRQLSSPNGARAHWASTRASRGIAIAAFRKLNLFLFTSDDLHKVHGHPLNAGTDWSNDKQPRPYALYERQLPPCVHPRAQARNVHAL